MANLNKNEFAEQMLKLANNYEKKVLNGKIKVCKWIRLAVERGIEDKKRDDIRFDEESVKKVYRFISFVNIPIKNEIQQFILSDFQAWIIRELFGYFYVDTGERRYQTALIWTARKSGKSMFIVVLMLYLLLSDGELEPEIYMAATTSKQASQMLKYAKTIIKNSPALEERLRPYRYDIKSKTEKGGVFVPTASNADNLDGLNVSGYCVDEFHAHPDTSLYDIFKTGTVARFNPLGFVTSTAGFDKEKPFYQMVEIGKQVLNLEVANDRVFYAMFTLDDGDDIEDTTNWIKANPNIGQTITVRTLKTAYEEAKLTPSTLVSFITKNLNIFVDNAEAWITDDDYVKCFNPVDVTNFIGAKVYIGLDLASTTDMASLVAVIDDGSGKLNVFPEFFFPNNEKNRIRKASGIDVKRWIDEGWVQQHETKTINYDLILERLKWYSENFQVNGLGYDKWNTNAILHKIHEAGIDTYACMQNASFYNEPLKFIERNIFEQNIDLSQNPVLRWNFTNVVLHRDGNGNIKPMKNRSKDAIDGVMALGMAVGTYLNINRVIEES